MAHSIIKLANGLSVITPTLDYFRETPLRVDFAGGWLDVPKFSCPQGRIVNVAVTPQVMIDDLDKGRYSGLGGSAARSILQGVDSISSEIEAGAGWQDPAIMLETGLCVWQSGERPTLLLKVNPDQLLRGRMAIVWTGARQDGTVEIANHKRDFAKIAAAGMAAEVAVRKHSFDKLCAAVSRSYAIQCSEGMKPLPEAGVAMKYCGAGHGGNAVYLFADADSRQQFLSVTPDSMAIEPYLKATGE